MQDNSFDNNIEQDLHELAIEPSGKVWTAIEKELDKNKRRLIPAWWFFLFLLMAGSATIWYIDQQNKTVAGIDKIQPSQRVAETDYTEKDSLFQNSHSTAKTGNEVLTPNAVTIETQKYSTGTAISTSPDAGIRYPGNKSGRAKPTGKKYNRKGRFKGVITAPLPEATDSVEIDIASHDSLATDNQHNVDAVVNADPKDEDATNTNSITRLATATRDTSITTVSGPKKASAEKGWKKQWVLSVGSSSLARLVPATTDGNYAAGPITPGVPGNSVRIRNEYKFEQGIHIYAGLNIGRKLTKKTSLFTGLGYIFQNLDIDITRFRDSLSNIGSSGSYTNVSITRLEKTIYLHTLNIPLLVKVTMGPKLSFNAGAYNHILIASNMAEEGDLFKKKIRYIPMLHLQPGWRINKFTVGPFLNVGLAQFARGKQLLNYGIGFSYQPRK